MYDNLVMTPPYRVLKEMGVAKGTHVRLPELVLAPKYKTFTALYTVHWVEVFPRISPFEY